MIFAFFFTIAGASLDLGAIGGYWLAALILLVARTGFTYWGAKLGTRWARASDEIQGLSWRGLISQGGVTLGLLLLLKSQFPAIGDGAAANIGSGCGSPERVALTVGTTGAMRVVLPPGLASVPAGLWLYWVDKQRSLLGGPDPDRLRHAYVHTFPEDRAADKVGGSRVNNGRLRRAVRKVCHRIPGPDPPA